MFWPQFATQVLTGGCEPQFGGKSGRRGLDTGLLSSPVVTSYGFPIVTIGLYLSPFSQCSDLSWTDRQTDGIGLAKGGTIHGSASAAKNVTLTLHYGSGGVAIPHTSPSETPTPIATIVLTTRKLISSSLLRRSYLQSFDAFFLSTTNTVTTQPWMISSLSRLSDNSIVSLSSAGALARLLLVCIMFIFKRRRSSQVTPYHERSS